MVFPILLLLEIFLLVASKPLEEPKCAGYESCPTTNDNALNVHIVPHSHDDVGWLKTYDQYYFQDVQNVINSVINALKQNPERRFVQVETAFFKKWWEQQKESTKDDVRNLVNNGQFEIINGAWSMNDEAAPNYQYTIDQYTLGLRYLEDNLGKCSRPRVGWQIDPFGHSREQASLNAQFGFDSLFFARLDYRDKINRLQNKNGDLIWRGSDNLGNQSDIFTSVLYNHYSAPPGFCFDIVCDDEPIIDDEESPDYNYKNRVEQFANFVREQAARYPTNNIIVVMGDDFRYQAAFSSYINTDRLIKGFELFPQTYQNRSIKVFYSTPSCYAKGVNDYALSNDYRLQIKTDDFFPYADGVGSLVVGYFTSRPASKRFVRQANNLLQVANQLATVASLDYSEPNINSLKEAMGVLQHHDAITGTELIDVTHDYHRLLSAGISRSTDTINSILSDLITGSSGDDLQFKSCLLVNASYCAETKSDSFTILVYNPLSRFISSPVSLPVDSTDWVITDPNGENLAYQVDPSITDFSTLIDEPASPYSLEFIAEDLPPLGFKVYTFSSGNSDKRVKKPKLKSSAGAAAFELDEVTHLLSSATINGVALQITQEFLYYISGGASQAYIFTPDGSGVKTVATEYEGGVKINEIEGDIFTGVLQEFSPWVKQIIKVYKNDPSYIQFDWVVGPIDFSDGGKEVISRFTTPLLNNGTFFTDSNGREMLKRVRNFRPDYEYTNEQPVSGNYYPITSKITINQDITEDGENIEVAVLNDRAQGGSSVDDGQIELMVHRAIRSLDADTFGLDEQEYGHEIVVRGEHYLTFGQRNTGDGQRSLPALERDIEQRKLHQPWIFYTNEDVTGKSKILEYSTLKQALPDNVQILTLQPWDDDTLLIRLEHILAKEEDAQLSKDVTVDLEDLFFSFTINNLEEMTLAGNIPLSEKTRLEWPGSTNDGSTKFVPQEGFAVTLSPMQIKTFLATVTYNA